MPFASTSMLFAPRLRPRAPSAYTRGRACHAAALLAWLFATALAPSAQAQPPPTTGTDMEIDPDAPKPEEKPLPPPEPGTWGVGGAEDEEDGRFAPKGKTGSLKEEEEDAEKAKEDAKPADLGPPRALSFETVIGFGDIRDVNNDSNPTKILVVSFIPGFRWRFGDTWAATLRVPFSTGTIEGPTSGSSDDFKSVALGNIELAVRPTFAISRTLRLPVGLALAIPSAPGDHFPPPAERGVIGQALLNQAAAATRGWEENALFTPRRFGITPNVGIAFDWKALRLAADTKVEILARAGGNEPPTVSNGSGQPVLHNPAVNWVTALSAFYEFFDGKLTPGLRFWLSVGKLPVSAGTRDYSGAQAVMEPHIASRVRLNQEGSLALGGGIGYILPLGGHLGGAQGASVGGFRIRAEFLF